MVEMSPLEKLQVIPGWQEQVAGVAQLIGTTFKNQRLLTKTSLLGQLDRNQQQVIEWLFSVKPADFNADMTFYGLAEPPHPNEFRVLRRYLNSLKGKRVLDIQYVPKPAYQAFESMGKAMEDEIGSDIRISSAYRSPAFQALVVCYNLRRHNYDVAYTFKYTALPGYSEHGLFPDVALDLQFGGEEYVRTDRIEDFAATREFKWLEKHASRFGFYLPYHKNNGAGLIFEPWHWRFKP
jgi:D-alanyl-D-alanine carboxypeptidase